jgi:hypothetical protein
MPCLLGFTLQATARVKGATARGSRNENLKGQARAGRGSSQRLAGALSSAPQPQNRTAAAPARSLGSATAHILLICSSFGASIHQLIHPSIHHTICPTRGEPRPAESRARNGSWRALAVAAAPKPRCPARLGPRSLGTLPPSAGGPSRPQSSKSRGSAAPRTQRAAARGARLPGVRLGGAPWGKGLPLQAVTAPPGAAPVGAGLGAATADI